jgi:nitrogen fixation NifU-like protein
VKLFLKVAGGHIEDIGFQGSGCAISKASASVMTTMVKNKSIEEIKTLFKQFQDLITGKGSDISMAELGKMAVFGGVREFPVRVKCAALAWHTLLEAFETDDSVATTE